MNLSISNLTKVYNNGVKAMDNLSIQIGKGMFGLLGPNGAGKSTLMRTVATLQNPDSGQIDFRGIDVVKDKISLRKVLGYLPQDFGVYPKVSADELLNYFATLKGIASKKDRKKMIDEVLELTNLTEVRKKNVDGYSGGMKQRFGIAQMLLNKPKLIIVDEPTAGLDPAERVRFLNILREIGTENTVIFSTHIVDDVKDLCHEMAIMNGGQFLAQFTPSEGTQKLMGKIWMKTIKRNDLEEMERKFSILSSHYNPDNTLNIRVFANTLPGDGFSSVEPILEDVYFMALREEHPVAVA